MSEVSNTASGTAAADATDAPDTTSAAAVQENVQSAIKEISHIATLPEVTMKIIQLVEDPDSTAQDLNKVISNDPALGARILKVVNSAFYGLPGQIGSINRAIVLLGLNAVKNIAIAASLAKLFRGGKISANFDARDLWQHSIATATATRMLSNKAGLGLPDEAFLAGLIHDIGIMVEIQARRPKFIEALAKVENEGCTLREAEYACIGATHEMFGAGLCKLWKFPTSFQYVTGFHHHPMDLAEKNRALACLVHIADHIAGKMELGFAHDVRLDSPIDPQIMATLNLNESAIEEICAQLPEAMEEAKGIFQSAGV
ncbi:MAG: HDOD domain-containing protein [Planctomycetota bacterium]